MNAGPSIGEVFTDTRRRLAAAGIAQPGLEARLLLADTLGCEMSVLIGHPERRMAAGVAGTMAERVARRVRREPLAYILGRREFWSLSLRIDARTLVPRPDSETLVEAALRYAGGRRGLRILDLGTGSGCLLLALLAELPDARGIGVDISEPALTVARANAEGLALGRRAAFICGNWADAIAGEFDVVISNPPYIADDEWAALDDDVRGFEPHIALRGGEDGLAAYRRIVPALPRLLAPRGRGFFEVGGAAAVGLPELAADSGMQVVGMRYDLEGRRRCLEIAVSVLDGAKNFLGNQLVPV